MSNDKDNKNKSKPSNKKNKDTSDPGHSRTHSGQTQDTKHSRKRRRPADHNDNDTNRGNRGNSDNGPVFVTRGPPTPPRRTLAHPHKRDRRPDTQQQQQPQEKKKSSRWDHHDRGLEEVHAREHRKHRKHEQQQHQSRPRSRSRTRHEDDSETKSKSKSQSSKKSSSERKSSKPAANNKGKSQNRSSTQSQQQQHQREYHGHHPYPQHLRDLHRKRRQRLHRHLQLPSNMVFDFDDDDDDDDGDDGDDGDDDRGGPGGGLFRGFFCFDDDGGDSYEDEDDEDDEGDYDEGDDEGDEPGDDAEGGVYYIDDEDDDDDEWSDGYIQIGGSSSGRGRSRNGHHMGFGGGSAFVFLDSFFGGGIFPDLSFFLHGFSDLDDDDDDGDGGHSYTYVFGDDADDDEDGDGAADVQFTEAECMDAELVPRVVPDNHFTALGISVTLAMLQSHAFSDREIRKAYRDRALEVHPDKCKLPNAVDLFRRLQAAFDLLKDAAARARYQAQLLRQLRVASREWRTARDREAAEQARLDELVRQEELYYRKQQRDNRVALMHLVEDVHQMAQQPLALPPPPQSDL